MTVRRTPEAARLLVKAAQKRRLKPVKGRRNNTLPSDRGREKYRRDYKDDYHSDE